MIHVTWLQSRTQNLVTAVALFTVGLLLAVTGPHLAHLYDQTVANCAAAGDCGAARDIFARDDASLRTGLDSLVLVIPALVGIFWGAPMVARELETGTHRLVWAQSVTRTRWFFVKLALLGAVSVVVAGLLSLMVTLWAAPLDRVHAAQFTTFDERDLVPIGYAAFAFALAVTAGCLIRRTLPAIAAALVVFAGARLAVWHFVRPHLAAVTHGQLPMSAAHHVGFISGPAGAQFVAGNPAIDNTWILSSRIIDKGGHPASAVTLHRFFESACPVIASGVSHLHAAGSARPPSLVAFRDCVGQIGAHFGLAVTYQPAHHYWQLQWLELAVFVAGAVALSAFCFWWVRRRV